MPAKVLVEPCDATPTADGVGRHARVTLRVALAVEGRADELVPRGRRGAYQEDALGSGKSG